MLGWGKEYVGARCGGVRVSGLGERGWERRSDERGGERGEAGTGKRGEGVRGCGGGRRYADAGVLVTVALVAGWLARWLAGWAGIPVGGKAWCKRAWYCVGCCARGVCDRIAWVLSEPASGTTRQHVLLGLHSLPCLWQEGSVEGTFVDLGAGGIRPFRCSHVGRREPFGMVDGACTRRRSWKGNMLD